MKQVGKLCRCKVCKRMILIMSISFGTRHTTNTEVKCWDCLSEEDKKKAIDFFHFSEEQLLSDS